MVLFFYENILTKAVVIHTGKFCKLHGKKLKLKEKILMKAFLSVPFFSIWLFYFVLFCSVSWGQFYNFPVLIYIRTNCCLFPPLVFVLFCLVFPFALFFVVVVVNFLLLLFLNFSR